MKQPKSIPAAASTTAFRDDPVQCTRCRHKHMSSTRVSKPNSSSGPITFSDLVCPRCSCKSYYDLTPELAWCWATGLIEFGEALPQPSPEGDGAIKIAEGPRAYLRSYIGVCARHGYGPSGTCLLVPGVPEAKSQLEKGHALGKWLTWCSAKTSRPAQRITFAKEH